MQRRAEPENKWADGKRLSQGFGYTQEALEEFRQKHPDRHVKLLAAGFYLGNIAMLPEETVDKLLEVYPSIAANYPNVEKEVLSVARKFKQ